MPSSRRFPITRADRAGGRGALLGRAQRRKMERGPRTRTARRIGDRRHGSVQAPFRLDAVEDRTGERIRVADATRRRARSVRYGTLRARGRVPRLRHRKATLRARRDADATRTRRNFETHLLLRDSLLRWYEAIDRLEPCRVRFGLPEGGISADLVALGPRRVRSGAALFEQLLELLPA